MNIEKLDNNKVKFTISVNAEDFEKGLQEAYLKNRGKMSIQGFRKGKAPRKIIEVNYGETVFFDDAINLILPKTYMKIVVDNDLDVVADPDFSLTKVSKEEGFEVNVEVFVKPEVAVSNYKGIEIEKVETEVTEEDLNAKVEAERKNNARKVFVERPAEDGDVVNIDFEGFMDGVAFEGGKADGHDLVIGSKSFIGNFEEQLIGKNAGEELEVNVTFPEDYHQKDLAGKPAMFKVKVNEISVDELPELNDEFASEVSEFETLAEYKEDLMAKLKEEKANNAAKEKENKVLQSLVEDNDFEVPQPMIDTRVNQMVEDFKGQVSGMGLTLEQYLQFTGNTVDSLKELYSKQATFQIKVRLLLEAVGKEESFEVSEEDIDKELAMIAESYNLEVEKIKATMRPQDKQGLTEDIKTQKALKLILDSAVEK